MVVVSKLRSWWAARRPKPLNQLLAVDFDDVGARVVVLERLAPDWNQSFAWSDVVRVCLKDAGLSASDQVFIKVANREKPIVVLTEARGGSAFFGALCERGLFPETTWRKAMGETGGATHCWPPVEK